MGAATRNPFQSSRSAPTVPPRDRAERVEPPRHQDPGQGRARFDPIRRACRAKGTPGDRLTRAAKRPRPTTRVASSVTGSPATPEGPSPQPVPRYAAASPPWRRDSTAQSSQGIAAADHDRLGKCRWRQSDQTAKGDRSERGRVRRESPAEKEPCAERRKRKRASRSRD